MKTYLKNIILFSILIYSSVIFAEDYNPNIKKVYKGAELFGDSVKPFITNIDMQRLPTPPPWRPGDPVKEIPKLTPKGWVEPEIAEQKYDIDPLLSVQAAVINNQSGGRAFDTTILNFDGSGFTGGNPADTVGSIGNNYYIQIVNASRVLVFDKVTGTLAPNGSFLLDSLAAGSGTACTNGRGDPIMMFDETVSNGPGNPTGRWVLTEFISTGFCVYISATDDPLAGTWFVYEFTSQTGGLPDYPKYGVWPDAYYIGANESVRQYALDRENMLQGLTARPAQVFQAPGLAGFGFQMMQPADWDGDLAPANGAPGLFFRHRDDEVHNAGSNNPNQDFLEIWEFQVDWDTPANSTFTGPTNLPITEIESELCGLTAFACVPMPGSGTQLDPLREPVMLQAQYRNFGTHESIYGSLVTDIDGNDLHGIRWFELRNSPGGYTLFQEGTYSPDSTNRWMSSIAADESGNIAIGYNVSDSTSVFPGMRYAGRLLTDPAGTLPRGENSIIEGTAANGSNRWGDYSQLQVDPVDGCTFWYTAQYNVSSSYSTRIASFKYDECGDPGFSLVTADSQQQLCVANQADGFVASLDVAALNGFTNDVSLAFNPLPLPTGFTGSINPTIVSPPGNTSVTINADQTVAAGNYSITVDGTASGATDKSQIFNIDVYDAAPAMPTQTLPANAATNVPNNSVTFEWNAVPFTSSYVLEIATDVAFLNIIHTETVMTNSANVSGILNSNTEYFWSVRGSNICSEGPNSFIFSFTTAPLPGDCPVGQDSVVIQSYDFESGAQGWTSGTNQGANTWTLSTNNPTPGGSIQHWHVDDQDTTSDTFLTSPLISLPSDQSPLSFQFNNYQEMEDNGGTSCWDGGILEISTNGGAFIQVDNSLLGTDPYDGPFSGGPLSGAQGWCGDPQAYLNSIVDINAQAGDNVQFRFRVSTDGSVGRPGWDIDDILIKGCELSSNPAISVTKTATLTTDNGHPGEADVDDVITFNVSVENTGNVALTALVVNDSMQGALTCSPLDLAPAETATCNAYTYTVLQTDVDNGGTIDNTANASMTDAGNPDVLGSASTQTVINQALYKDSFEDQL